MLYADNVLIFCLNLMQSAIGYLGCVFVSFFSIGLKQDELFASRDLSSHEGYLRSRFLHRTFGSFVDVLVPCKNFWNLCGWNFVC